MLGFFNRDFWHFLGESFMGIFSSPRIGFRRLWRFGNSPFEIKSHSENPASPQSWGWTNRWPLFSFAKWNSIEYIGYMGLDIDVLKSPWSSCRVNSKNLMIHPEMIHDMSIVLPFEICPHFRKGCVTSWISFSEDHDVVLVSSPGEFDEPRGETGGGECASESRIGIGGGVEATTSL